MESLIRQLPWLVGMGLLAFASAFFSASEAALFSLGRTHRRRLEQGNAAQRIAVGLLADAEQLLTAVLFWNLVGNIAYFALVSTISIQWEQAGLHALAVAFSMGSMLVLIFLSEMLPKSLAVLRPFWVATLVGVPLAASVRAFDPLMPFFRWSLVISRRLVWPGFVPEDYLRVRDLERALELSTSDTALLKQEQSVLERLVSLSEFRADEMMRPRTRFTTYRPPVALADLRGQLPSSGYVLLAEEDADEVVAAVPLTHMAQLPSDHLEHYAEEVIYVPWCSNVATVFEALRRQDLQVAAVVNEFGETIGIVTLDDVLDTIFSDNPSRSARLLQRTPISEVEAGVWHVTGMTSLRRLSRYFGVPLPSSKSLTMAGVVGEILERFPVAGDEGRWGDFHFKVLLVTELGQLIVELTRNPEAEGAP